MMNHVLLKGFLIFIFFLLAAAISPHGPENQIFDARKIKVLYVGNSLTYSNDLPGLVEELGRMQGVRIQSKVIAKPNYALEDHWLEGTIQSEIKNNHYDFVVAQQGPSALPESQVMLLESAVRFAELCKETKTVFALYMVWPSKSRSFDHDNVIYSYSNTAKKTASLLCPAGLAWKYAWEEDPNLPLYGNDNFHPSIMGSVLASFIVYGVLTSEHNFDFLKYEKASWRQHISKESLGVLKAVANKALNN